MNSATGPNAYYDTEKIVDEVSQNRHREPVGGMWEEIGELQLDFLVTQGLAPSTKLIDIGCDGLRGGVHFVAFLEPRNYYGMDISEERLDVGYDVEPKNRGLQAKLPRANLVADGAFPFAKFSATSDVAFAQALFSHSPADLIRQCLVRLSPCMAPNGRLFGTFFIAPDDRPAGAP